MTNLSRRTLIKCLGVVGADLALMPLVGCAKNSDSENESKSEPEDTSHEKPKSEELVGDRLASFLLISDAHIAEGDKSASKLTTALRHMAALDHKLDAIVIAGDLTDHGLQSEYELAFDAMKKSSFSLEEDFIFVCGNHDQRNETEPENMELYDEFHQRFVKNCNIPALYYDTYVADQHLIILGPDALGKNWVRFAFSDEQLSWLDSLLAKDAENNQTSFIICHEPIPGTVSGAYEKEWGYNNSLNDPQRLKSVLKKYKNYVYISGHSHVYPAVNQNEKSGITYVTTGSTSRCYDKSKSESNKMKLSFGMYMDVYESGYNFQVRDLETGTWLEQTTILKK